MRLLSKVWFERRGWAPQGALKAAIMLVHGHGEHVARYDHVAAALAEKGYAVLGFDLRGHGKSGGPRGHTPSYDALKDDIASFSQQTEQRYAGLPHFLYGHSLSGNLVLNYALRRKPDLHGVIATGPWLKLAFDPPASQVTLGRLMNGIAPGFSSTANWIPGDFPMTRRWLVLTKLIRWCKIKSRPGCL